MLADSRSDVGHFVGLDQRRNGTELILINQTEIGNTQKNEMEMSYANSSNTSREMGQESSRMEPWPQ